MITRGRATKDAGEIAGLEVVRLVNEPTAACLAYGIDKLNKEMKILVYDFGGGTLDVTIMEFGNGVFEVKATSGDTQLGGTDMDNALVDFLLKEIKASAGVDISNDKQAMQRLRESCREGEDRAFYNIANRDKPAIPYNGSWKCTGSLHLYTNKGKA